MHKQTTWCWSQSASWYLHLKNFKIICVLVLWYHLNFYKNILVLPKYFWVPPTWFGGGGAGCERNVSLKIIARFLGSFRAIFPEILCVCVLGEIPIQCENSSCLPVHPVPSTFHRNSLILKISAWLQVFPVTAQSFTKYRIQISRWILLPLVQPLLRFVQSFYCFTGSWFRSFDSFSLWSDFRVTESQRKSKEQQTWSCPLKM